MIHNRQGIKQFFILPPFCKFFIFIFLFIFFWDLFWHYTPTASSSFSYSALTPVNKVDWVQDKRLFVTNQTEPRYFCNFIFELHSQNWKYIKPTPPRTIDEWMEWNVIEKKRSESKKPATKIIDCKRSEVMQKVNTVLYG